MSAFDTRYILASTKQKENPVIKIIEKTSQVKYETDQDSVCGADFRLGSSTCALFLAMSYHKKTPEYIGERMRLVQKERFTARILMVLIDIPNTERYMTDLFELTMKYYFTLLPVFDNEHAADALLELKQDRSSSIIQNQPTAERAQSSTSSKKTSAQAKLAAENETGDQEERRQQLEMCFQASKSGINSTDVHNLCRAYDYDLLRMAKANKNELGMIKGMGGVKLKRFEALFNQPFCAD